MKTRIESEQEWFHKLDINEPVATKDAFRAGWFAAMREVVKFCEDCPTCDEARVQAQRFG